MKSFNICQISPSMLTVVEAISSNIRVMHGDRKVELCKRNSVPARWSTCQSMSIVTTSWRKGETRGSRIIGVSVWVDEHLDLAFELAGTQPIAYDVGTFCRISSRRERFYPVSVWTTALNDLGLKQGEGSGPGWFAVRTQKDFTVHRCLLPKRYALKTLWVGKW